ncbi:hypothetical protein D3C80_1507880 [compost metagenome]
MHGHNCLMSYRFENRLAQDIVTLIRDQKLRERIASRGEQDSRRFTWERSMQIFQAELFDIVARN